MSTEASTGSSFCNQAPQGLADVRGEMRAFYAETKEKRLPGGWRKIGKAIGVSGAYARQIAYGEKPLTPALARAWLIATGDLQDTITVRACPDCGGVHVGRCHGKPVAKVAVLAPGEVVFAVTTSNVQDGAAVECSADIVRCACGQLFVKRSWNHRRCKACSGGKAQQAQGGNA